MSIDSPRIYPNTPDISPFATHLMDWTLVLTLSASAIALPPSASRLLFVKLRSARDSGSEARGRCAELSTMTYDVFPSYPPRIYPLV